MYIKGWPPFQGRVAFSFLIFRVKYTMLLAPHPFHPPTPYYQKLTTNCFNL